MSIFIETEKTYRKAIRNKTENLEGHESVRNLRTKTNLFSMNFIKQKVVLVVLN